jgi:hypothetical protein
MKSNGIIRLCGMVALSAVISISASAAEAAFSAQVGTPNLSFSISDYQPPPANVTVRNDRGRPYYMERDRRVYMEKRHPGKRYKNKKHHEDNGRGHGYDKHDGHER